MIGVQHHQGIQKTERGMSQNQGLREGMQPATQRLQLVSYHERPGALLDQAERSTTKSPRWLHFDEIGGRFLVGEAQIGRPQF